MNMIGIGGRTKKWAEGSSIGPPPGGHPIGQPPATATTALIRRSWQQSLYATVMATCAPNEAPTTPISFALISDCSEGYESMREITNRTSAGSLGTSIGLGPPGASWRVSG